MRKEKDVKQDVETAREPKAEVKTESKTIKVRFKNHYIGRLGNFNAGKVYDLDKDTYELFKDECEVVK